MESMDIPKGTMMYMDLGLHRRVDIANNHHWRSSIVSYLMAALSSRLPLFSNPVHDQRVAQLRSSN